MVKLINRLFADYGAPARLVKAGEARPVLVFFRERSAGRLKRVLTPLGDIPQGDYLCYLPAEVPVEPGLELLLRGVSYRISRVEPKLGPGGRVYCHWALCVKKEGA